MKWSSRIASLAGIELRIHATFPLLLIWIAASRWLQTHDAAQAVSGVLLVCALFGLVVLHELGHALMARRFGIATRDITLLPIGGVARLDKMPDRPGQELLVALAGPAVNVVLAALLLGVAALADLPVLAGDVEHGSPIVRLLWINVALAIFNLLPAFPMDGGRALRALLAMRLPRRTATTIAARLGQTLAVALGLIGLLGNPVLVFIALFVWMGAEGERQGAVLHDVVEGVTVGAAMISDMVVLSPHDTLAAAIDVSVHGFQHDFAVVDAGALVGVLSRGDLLRALAEHGPTHTVGTAMDRSPSVAHPGDPLESALEALALAPRRCLPVVDRGGALVGLLTLDGLGELVALRGVQRSRQTVDGTRRAA